MEYGSELFAPITDSNMRNFDIIQKSQTKGNLTERGTAYVKHNKSGNDKVGAMAQIILSEYVRHRGRNFYRRLCLKERMISFLIRVVIVMKKCSLAANGARGILPLQ